MIALPNKLLQRGSSVTSSLLPAIFQYLQPVAPLTGAQQMTLLGLSNEDPLQLEEPAEKAKLTRDLLERASYIWGSTSPRKILLPDRCWLTSGWPHQRQPAVQRHSAADRCFAGQVVDLAVVRDFLDAERGGW